MNKLDLEETTRRFHDIYEQVAKEYGYKTRKDPKELDFNSPNGMTMLKTVEVITTPYLEEIERLNNIINTMLEFNLFAEECPLNFGYTERCNEEKAQDVFYEDDYCEKTCNDDYKKCWLKYFERLQELKENEYRFAEDFNFTKLLEILDKEKI
ncbi:MAG: hypothetical protein IIZ40_04750 [Bacilli bacterium]|nr:hypothetical protein [Bacilli bacterium]